MSNDNVSELKNPGVANEVRDVLTEVLREGARTLLAQAIEEEVAEFLQRHRDRKDALGHARLVRNGYLPRRMIQTGIGAVPVTGPAGAGSGRQDSLYLLDPAAVLTAHKDDRRVTAVVVPERHLDRRFSGGAGIPPGARRAGIGRGHDQPVKSSLAR